LDEVKYAQSKRNYYSVKRKWLHYVRNDSYTEDNPNNSLTIDLSKVDLKYH